MLSLTATTTVLIMASAVSISAFVFPAPNHSSFGRYHQESSSYSSSRIDSTFVRDPQTFSTTNFGFRDPQSQNYNIGSSLTRRARAPAGSSYFKSSTSQQQQQPIIHSSTVTVHGGGVLRTWSFDYNAAMTTEEACINIQSEGSPVDATVELWEGPNYSPVYLRTYSQDGSTHPLSVKLLLDSARTHSLAIRNTGPNTFPLQAAVARSNIDANFQTMLDQIGNEYEDNLQGGASLSYPIDSTVERTQLLLRTEGRPLNVRVELMQGPSNNKMIAEIQSMDGIPMLLSFETPGYANVVRVINMSPLEFPIISFVDPSHLDFHGSQEDHRHQFYGGNFDRSRGYGRRERRSTGGYANGYGSDTNRYGPSATRDLGFKSSSMNRSSHSDRRVLASDLNRHYAAPVQHDTYTTKPKISSSQLGSTIGNLKNHNRNGIGNLKVNSSIPKSTNSGTINSTINSSDLNSNTINSSSANHNSDPNSSDLNSSTTTTVSSSTTTINSNHPNSSSNTINSSTINSSNLNSSTNSDLSGNVDRSINKNNDDSNDNNINLIREGGRFGSVADRSWYNENSRNDSHINDKHQLQRSKSHRQAASPSSYSAKLAWYENANGNGGLEYWRNS